MASKETVFQYAIRSESIGRPNHRITYVYACNGCGDEVRGYANKRVRGHVWCQECYRRNQRMYIGNTRNNAVLERIKTNLSTQKINGVLYYKADDIVNLFRNEVRNGI